jgi:hypothetical protein
LKGSGDVLEPPLRDGSLQASELLVGQADGDCARHTGMVRAPLNCASASGRRHRPTGREK